MNEDKKIGSYAGLYAISKVSEAIPVLDDKVFLRSGPRWLIDVNYILDNTRELRFDRLRKKLRSQLFH